MPFQASLDDIESQKREVEKAQKAKTDLLEQLNNRLTWSIRFFEAVYQLADLGFHADRLRVTINARSTTGEPAGESGEEGDTDGEEVKKSSETAESSATPSSSET